MVQGRRSGTSCIWSVPSWAAYSAGQVSLRAGHSEMVMAQSEDLQWGGRKLRSEGFRKSAVRCRAELLSEPRTFAGLSAKSFTLDSPVPEVPKDLRKYRGESILCIYEAC
jgi:hypothetical protein